MTCECNNTTGTNITPDYTIPTNQPNPLFNLSNCADSANMQIYVDESTQIAGAPLNIFKLMGLNEFTKTQDLLSEGTPISSGQFVDFPTSNAFDLTSSQWRSPERGQYVTCKSYIGYDFGFKKLNNGRLRYQSGQGEIRKSIHSITIKQGNQQKNRITKARIERSDDGVKWFGVDIINLIDDEKCHTYNIKKAAPARLWKITPLKFNGGQLDCWYVQTIELSESSDANINDVQIDYGIMENINRSYSKVPINIKGFVVNQDFRAELSRYAIQIPELSEIVIKFGFVTVISNLGRPFVVGDIIEIPHRAQYDINLNLVKLYVEVVDVSWDGSSFTPGWVPTVQVITCQPAIASHETKDVFGNINKPSNETEYENMKNSNINTDLFDIDDNITSTANQDVPQMYSDTANLREFTEQELIDNPKYINNLQEIQPPGYIEDGLPPNGESYTEGEKFPDSPSNKQYHRVTYPKETSIPARLYQYNSSKKQWIFKEEDRRSKYSIIKQTQKMFIVDDTAISSSQVGK